MYGFGVWMHVGNGTVKALPFTLATELKMKTMNKQPNSNKCRINP